MERKVPFLRWTLYSVASCQAADVERFHLTVFSLLPFTSLPERDIYSWGYEGANFQKITFSLQKQWRWRTKGGILCVFASTKSLRCSAEYDDQQSTEAVQLIISTSFKFLHYNFDRWMSLNLTMSVLVHTINQVNINQCRRKWLTSPDVLRSTLSKMTVKISWRPTMQHNTCITGSFHTVENIEIWTKLIKTLLYIFF